VQEDQKLYLAHLVREHRKQLKQVVEDLLKRGEPMSELEARLLIEATTFRLEIVENHLLIPVEPDFRRSPLSAVAHMLGIHRLWSVLARIRSWGKPRLGILRQYQPRPLRVPRKYLQTALPDPAPTISIVTPSFRQGRFIERTIHSVLEQEYPALEYIVQDGGSIDETLEVLRRFDGRLTHWASEPDEGQAEAINRGFARTTGEIMAWLNSDDLLLPGALACVSSYFAKHPDVDVVYGHRVMIDEEDGQIGAWILPRHSNRALMLADWIPQETLFWRRRIWDAVEGSVDPSFKYALDWDLLLRFREAGANMVRLPRFLGAFRVHDEQKTTAADAIGLEEMARLRERVHERPVSVEEALVRLRPYFVRHIAAHTRQRIVDRLPLRRVDVAVLPRDRSAVVRPGETVLHPGRARPEGSRSGAPQERRPAARQEA
jgi:GT2 family glycosyltransferase